MEVRKSKSTQLTDDAVSALQKALRDTKESSDNARLSKNYIKKVLGANIGDRGGIVILREAKKQDHSIWAIVKSRYMSKAELLGPPGSFGKVKIIENVVTGERKALKVLCDSRSQLKSEFNHEAEALAALGLGYSCIIEKKYAPDEEHDVDKHHNSAIIMDIAPGQNFFHILKQGILTPLERINIFLDLLDFVQLMHRLGFIHLDLKPENMMYDRNNKEINIIDYGATRKIDSERSSITTPGYIPPDLEGYNECIPDFDIFALARVAREIFDFRISVEVSFGRKYFGCDPNAAKAFDTDDRATLSKLILDMENENRIFIENAIDRMNEFKTKWLKAHPQPLLELKAPDRLTLKMKLKSKLYPPTLFVISPEEKKVVSKQSALALGFNQFATQLENYSKQEQCKLLRRNLAHELANKLREHAAILTNPNVNLEQQVCIATQTIQAIELTMWKLFQKTEPKQIKKGYWSTQKKSVEDLSISDLFSNCRLKEWRELKNALNEDFQVLKKFRA